MQFDYFYGAKTEQYSFYTIPKMLIQDQKFKNISMDAKVLYAIMLSRSALSYRNNYIDGDGKVYIIFPVQSIMEELNCCNQKAIKTLKELENKNLIEKVIRGQGKAALIYVKDFTSEIKDDNSEVDEIKEQDVAQDIKENRDIEKVDNYDNEYKIGLFKRTKEVAKDNSGGKEDNQRTERINTDTKQYYKEPREENTEELLENKLHINELILSNDKRKDDIELMLLIIKSVFHCRDDYIKIGKNNIPYTIVSKQFKKLTKKHLQYVLDKTTGMNNIRNKKHYFITCIYNSINELENLSLTKITNNVSQFNNFMQRNYSESAIELERKLLSG